MIRDFMAVSGRRLDMYMRVVAGIVLCLAVLSPAVSAAPEQASSSELYGSRRPTVSLPVRRWR